VTDLLPSARPPGLPEAWAHALPPAEELDWTWLPADSPAPDAATLARARRQTAALLADRGVTYGAGGDPGAWRLDAAPLVIGEDAWSGLENAVAQRAAVLDALLADLYGPRTLLRDAVVPPELVLADPAFLRAVDRLPRPQALTLHAVDLGRDADGRWVAVADRTQAPSGAGYAMVDRRVVAQSLAGVYRRTSIRRIGPFFHALRRALDAAAAPTGASPGRRDDEHPLTVLLTPGPHSETAFDQAYLATMLGVPLVEGSDLVVREGRVWLEGMGDLQPVDVILRRVDAAWCDPLDLRTDSGLGVPGLVRALRAGTVAVVNPLGSGVLEHPGLAAYLPRVARAVLGEDLALPSPATWWCGDPAARAHTLAHLDTLVLRHTAGGPPVLGWTLDAGAREALAARIGADPLHWAAHEPVPGTTSAPGRGTPGAPDPSGAARPAGASGTPGPSTAQRPSTLRTFAVRDDGAYRVLAGGLALLAPPGADLVSSSRGAIARDVWVIASDAEPVADPWALPGAEEAAPRRVVTLPPRTAENLFWLTRYAERAGATVRVLRAVVDRWYDHARRPESAGGRSLRVLLDAIGATYPAGWPSPSDAPGREAPLTGGPGRRTVRAFVLDRDVPGTVAWSVTHLADASAAVRDQMSDDLWLALASMERVLEEEQDARRAPGSTTGLLPVLDRLLEALLAVAGIAAESMLRDAGWYLMDAGRRLERASSLVEGLDLLTATHGEEVETLVLESLLLAHESSITYRRRHAARPEAAGVLDLLVSDAGNPRSLHFQVTRLAEDLAQVPSQLPTEARDRLAHDLVELVAELDPRAAASVGDGGRRAVLAELLASARWRLAELADEVARVHLAHRPAGRAMGDAWGLVGGGRP
jgi:uncharacterized circularly permuted ATP-grasp superfamily protein/uncharacterized alpha-E superfamily protein